MGHSVRGLLVPNKEDPHEWIDERRAMVQWTRVLHMRPYEDGTLRNYDTYRYAVLYYAYPID